MSAYDITGMIVWTPMAIWFWIALLRGDVDSDNVVGGFALALMMGSGSIFSIARVLGAHL